MEKLPICVLTGYTDSSLKFQSSEGPVIEYTFLPVGRVRIAMPTYLDLTNKRQFNNPILAAICRNAFERNEEPPLITQEFLTNEIKNLNYPKQFKEKAYHLLRHLYNKGGKDYKTFNLSSTIDYPICYCEGEEEFERVMNFLEEQYFIKWNDSTTFGKHSSRYFETRLTDSGIMEIEKELPTIPLIGLVSQEISTGDTDVDEKINHAKDLFFSESKSTDKMRSACEALSYVLEPLRKDLEQFFKAKDVSDFFQIVNTFDIRHNKDSTKQIQYDEQLEWIFYSLLNTINTYTKLRRRLGE